MSHKCGARSLHLLVRSLCSKIQSTKQHIQADIQTEEGYCDAARKTKCEKAWGFSPFDGFSRSSRKFTSAQTVECYAAEYQGHDARRKSFNNRRRMLHSLI